MAVVAGLFDSEADATDAMDRLLRSHIDDLDTRVVSGRGDTSDVRPPIAFPAIPNTGGVMGGGSAAGVPVPIDPDWFRGMGDVEQEFYYGGLREGATLALARVRDEDANRVRQLLRDFGARTYVKE